ncbi:MAG: hypothetical protein G01um101419_825 [Parcubacteria group bacterium Gr01-1014_19]|nr:MAG: hypothetical protein G01um101419_825 [Parcubacteria group bacterium Gr01-1014_19]
MGFHSWQFAVGFGCFWLIGLIMFYGMLSETYTKNWTLPRIFRNIVKGMTIGIPLALIFWILIVLERYRQSGHWDWTLSPLTLYTPLLFLSWVASVRLGERANRLSERKDPVN